MDFKDYSDWEPIEESAVQQEAAQAATANSPDATNLKKILLAGEVFKFAGLTPIFVYESASAKMAVYCQEYYHREILIN